MTILDRENTFAWGQALAGAAGTVASTDFIDTSVAGDPNKELCFELNISTAITAAATGTIEFQLRGAATEAGLATADPIWTSGTLDAAAGIAVGRIVQMRLPQGTPRWLGVYFVRATANTTAGAIQAFLSMDAQTAREA